MRDEPGAVFAGFQQTGVKDIKVHGRSPEWTKMRVPVALATCVSATARAFLCFIIDTEVRSTVRTDLSAPALSAACTLLLLPA